MDDWRQQGWDWQQFQKSLFKQMPFIGKEVDLKGLDQFVQKAIQSYMPEAMLTQAGLPPMMVSSLDYELFETHRSIFVRCRPPEASLRGVRFFANSRKLRIEFGDHTEEIPLPSDINPSRTIARMEDGVLEIRMLKAGHSEPLQEIYVRDED
ncbi:Hsp20/alpha crystallin family protein [Cohnella candidum]|uniref:Hsp20/alpha crystallin family protein n=1 Tax=Cohnella candidum TaxID=2674991 RepID=A0A3G3JXN6_9BACL|nr:Hsp20/alpha crystallin family protein [Cohnella candidum]AYQ72984.1 hypothetical protein EAV92_10665 [Cohnella candidum]